MKERKTIVISLKNILFIIFLFLVLSSIIFFNSVKLRLKPSSDLNESSRIFEKKENILFRYDIVRYSSKVIVTESDSSQEEVGVNVDKTNLNLGQIPKGSASKKFLNLTNNLEEPFILRFFVFGNISQLVPLEKELVIGPGESREYTIAARTDSSTNEGLYSGEIDIVTMIPKNKFAKLLEKVV